MNKYTFMLAGNHPITKTFESKDMDTALEHVKKEYINYDRMHFIVKDEKRLDAEFTYEKKRYSFIIVKE